MIRLRVLLFLLLTAVSVFPQKDDFKNFLKVGGDVFTAPAHFNSRDNLRLGLTAGGTAVAYLLDEEVQKFALNNHTWLQDKIFSMDAIAFEFALVSTVAIYSYGAIAKDSKTRELGLKLAETTFYSSIVNQLMKIVFGRSRPYMNEGNSTFAPFTFSFDQTSFPSGHSTLAFGYGHTMASRYDNVGWKILWYSLSSAMAYSRIYHNMHWFSDVVMGSAIGYFISEFVEKHSTNKGYTLNFTIPIL